MEKLEKKNFIQNKKYIFDYLNKIMCKIMYLEID